MNKEVQILIVHKSKDYNGTMWYHTTDLEKNIISITEGFGFSRNPRDNEKIPTELIDTYYKVTSKYGNISFMQTLDEAIELQTKVIQLIENIKNNNLYGKSNF